MKIKVENEEVKGSINLKDLKSNFDHLYPEGSGQNELMTSMFSHAVADLTKLFVGMTLLEREQAQEILFKLGESLHAVTQMASEMAQENMDAGKYEEPTKENILWNEDEDKPDEEVGEWRTDDPSLN